MVAPLARAEQEAAFLAAVDEVAAATSKLLRALATNAPPKNRVTLNGQQIGRRHAIGDARVTDFLPRPR
jgi:hypothetical protein